MIYVCGKNVDGQLGIANGEDFVCKPIALPDHIIDSKKTG